MTKSNLFKTAWRIAKEGAAKFGGSSKEYFAESLKLAYKIQGGIDMKFHALAVKTPYKGKMITAYLVLTDEGFKLAKNPKNATRFTDYATALKTANEKTKELEATVFVQTLGSKEEN